MDGVIVCAVTYCFCASTIESRPVFIVIVHGIKGDGHPGELQAGNMWNLFSFLEFFWFVGVLFVGFLGLLTGHLWVRTAWHPGTSPHGVSFGVFNVGGWLTHGGFAMEGDVDFLVAVEHRIVPAWVRNEHKGYTRARPHPGNCSIPQCFRRRKKGSVVCIGHERVLDERVNGWTRQNDLKRIQYELFGELFFFLMRRETFPTEAVRPRHVSTECLFSFVRPEDVRHPAGNDPLNQEALEELLGLDRAAPLSQRQAPRACTHQNTCFLSAEATHRVF